MKTVKITLSIIVMLAFIGLNETSGQWAPNSIHIYNTNSGNVGIGNNSPSTLLYVAKNMTEPTITVRNLGGAGGASFRMWDNVSGADWKFKATNLGGFKIRDNTYGLDVIVIEPNSNANMLYITNADNLGIGTSTPTAKLDVRGSYTDDGVAIQVGNSDVSHRMVLFGGRENDPNPFIQWKQGDPLRFSTDEGGWSEKMRITSGGSVGIGTSTPSVRLDVRSNTPAAGSRINIGNSDISHKLTLFSGSDVNPNPHILWNEGDSLTFMVFDGVENERMRITSDGKIGIGTTTPAEKLHVNGYFTLKNTTSYSFMYIDHPYTSGQSGLSFTNNGEWRAWIYYDEDDDLLRLSANNNPNADYALVIKNNSNIGINTATPAAKLEVYTDANAYTRLGNSPQTPHYFYHREIAAEGNAQSALYAYRTRDAANDGSSYSVSGSNQALRAYNYYGDLYTFGVAGFNWNDYTRCGGTLGADESGVYWGALGYRNNAGTPYGGYFTSYTTGTGKSNEMASIGIGVGAWGDLMGADIHGKVYGIYAEGANYALFSHGTVYKDALDVHLQENGTKTKTVLYTNVSTDVTVQTSGQATLSNGKTSIAFDPVFTTAVSSDLPVVVTVTPTGKSNGVYLSDVTSAGFTVLENNDGKSNVTVNYIAIGKRAGYENPSLSPEVIDAAYTGNLSNGLRPDADLQTNGEGLYYENGQLVVGIHPSTLPDPNKPKEDVPIAITTAIQGEQNQQPDDRAPIGD